MDGGEENVNDAEEVVHEEHMVRESAQQTKGHDEENDEEGQLVENFGRGCFLGI